jgi:hypothetical protein
MLTSISRAEPPRARPIACSSQVKEAGLSKRTVIAAIVAVIVALTAVGLVQYLRSMSGDTPVNPGASNQVGPAEGGALETGGALDTEDGFRHLPARDMPHTIEQYPPAGPETDNPPPSQNRDAQAGAGPAPGDHDINDNEGVGTQPR